MSKFDTLWAYVKDRDQPSLTLTFDEIHAAAGLPIDHSFLTFKKELESYGFRVVRISMKNQTVLFEKLP